MHFGSINPIKRKSQQQSNFQPVNWNTNILHTPQKSFIPRGPTPIKLARGSPSPLKKNTKTTKHLPSHYFTLWGWIHTDVSTANAETQTDDITDNNFFTQAIEKLSSEDHEIADEITKFIQLLKDGRYPVDNIAFLLFLDTVQFFGLKLSSEMTYRSETKRFWKISYKLFHSKFLYFIGGPKNAGQIKDGVAKRVICQLTKHKSTLLSLA